jgi:thioredoxin 1
MSINPIHPSHSLNFPPVYTKNNLELPPDKYTDFEIDVLSSKIPVLVYFWFHCPPCRMLAPIIDEIAMQYEGSINLVSINTGDNPNIISKYGLRSAPTLMVFNNGHLVEMMVGAAPKVTIINILEKYL